MVFFNFFFLLTVNELMLGLLGSMTGIIGCQMELTKILFAIECIT